MDALGKSSVLELAKLAQDLRAQPLHSESDIW
jgi:hypothetical protein